MSKRICIFGDSISHIVFKQSKPLFKISSLNNEQWEEVIDFTKIKKGGVRIDEILSRS